MGDDDGVRASAQRFRQVYSAYRQQRDLIAVGAYQRGTDKRVDEAIARWPQILEFLRQGERQRVDFASSVGSLKTLLESPLKQPGPDSGE